MTLQCAALLAGYLVQIHGGVQQHEASEHYHPAKFRVRKPLPGLLMVQTIPIEIDAASGTLTFTGPAIRIGRGFRESDMKGLADLGLKRSEHTYTEKIDGKFAGYVAVNYETPPLVLGGRSVKLSIRFRSGMLVDISVAIVGLEWWTRKGHKENVALRNILFPTGPNFEGGRARVWLDRNMGALCDAGTHFCLEYDALETDDPRPVRSRKKPKNN